MAQRSRLEDSLRWRAIGRMEAGQSQADVARWLNVNRSVVSRMWQQFLQFGNVSRRPGQGRPRVTTEREDRYLTLRGRRYRRSTARQLASDLTASTGTVVSRQTVYRRLRQRGLYCRRPAVCVPLTRIQRRDRLEWSHQHANWTIEQWANVLFTDESKFSVDNDSRRIRIWRESGTRFQDSNIVERDHFGGASIMVWAGILLTTRTALHEIVRVHRQGLTAIRYRDEVLAPHVRLFRGAVGPDFVLMDDNARPHRAHVVDDFLETEDIARMVWPARSPDLNPIEHVWDALGRRVASREHPPTTHQALRVALQEEWALLPQHEIDDIIRSMPRRCEACIAARGGHTQY